MHKRSRKRDYKSYVVTVRVPKSEIINRFKEEGFSLKIGLNRVEFGKKTNEGRIHGHLHFLSDPTNQTVIKIHEDIFSSLPIRLHFAHYPSPKVEKALEKILTPILRGPERPHFYFL